MTVKIGAALIDLSGTLHVEDKVIPGAVEALRRYVWTQHTVETLLILSNIIEHIHNIQGGPEKSKIAYCCDNIL